MVSFDSYFLVVNSINSYGNQEQQQKQQQLLSGIKPSKSYEMGVIRKFTRKLAFLSLLSRLKYSKIFFDLYVFEAFF